MVNLARRYSLWLLLTLTLGIAFGALNSTGSASGLPAATPSPTAAALLEELAAFPTSPTPTPGLLSILGDSTALPELGDGAQVTGSLGEETTEIAYSLPVRAGDHVGLAWEGDFAPALSVTDAGGEVIAAAVSADPVSALMLAFRAPATATLRVTISRSQIGTSGGEFSLEVTIQPTSSLPPAPVLTPLPTIAAAPAPEAPDAAGGAIAGDYLDAPCQSAAAASSGLSDSAYLAGVYTASGDSYAAEELTPTETFTTDDDLNAVFQVQNFSGTAQVAGVFCAPDGTWFDAGEDSYSNGGPYLLGLDWEYTSIPWTPGDWTVEIYVNDALELVLAFVVE